MYKKLKSVLIVLITVLISSCGPRDIDKNPKKLTEYGFEIYIVDGCEYIGRGIDCNYAVFTHKGNCKFCEQRNKNK